MENNVEQPKKSFSISLTAFLLVIAIIAIGVMAYFLFTLSNEKQNAEKNIDELNKKISGLENTISNLQTKSEKKPENNTSENGSSDFIPYNKYLHIGEELDGIDVLFVTDVIKNANNTYTLKGVLYTQYTLTQSELDKIINDKKMVLNGVTFTVKEDESSSEYGLYDSRDVSDNFASYKIKKKDSNEFYLERQAQIQNVWKLAHEYRQITIDKDVVVENDYTEEKSTVEKTFNNFKSVSPEETTNPFPSYTFKIENGKCIKVIKALTSI